MKKRNYVLCLVAVLLAATLSLTGCGESKPSGTFCEYHDDYHNTGEECDYMKYSPYKMTDSNGTVWKLFIEDNYDFILRGYKTENGKKVVKQVVGPTFEPVENENGSITLGVAMASVWVDNVQDESRTANLTEKYNAFTEKYCEEHDQAMAHIPVGINSVAMSIYDPDVPLEDILPGWGE